MFPCMFLPYLDSSLIALKLLAAHPGLQILPQLLVRVTQGMLFLAEQADIGRHPDGLVLQRLERELRHPVQRPPPSVEGRHHFIAHDQVLPSLQPVVLVFEAVDAALEMVALAVEGEEQVVDLFGVGGHEDGRWGVELLVDIVWGYDVGDV